MHRADSEVSLLHLLCEPVHLSLGVAEYHRLSDGQSVIEVTESVKLPLLTLNSNEELFDAFKSQFVTVEEMDMSQE